MLRHSMKTTQSKIKKVFDQKKKKNRHRAGLDHSSASAVLKCFSLSTPFFSSSSFFFFFFFGCVLRCCVWAFSSCCKRGATLCWRARASHCGGFSCCGARGPRARVSVVAVNGPSCSAACGIFPDQGSNPGSLHWQADP